MGHGVPRRKRRRLFRRAPPLSARHALRGAGASCGQTRVGGLDSVSGRGFGPAPLELGPAQLRRASVAELARAAPSRRWGSPPRCGSLVGTPVAALTPDPVWGMDGGSRAEPSISEEVQSTGGQAAGRVLAASSVFRESRPPRRGPHAPSCVAGTLVPVPANDSQPPAPSVAVCPKPSESDRREFES